MDYLELMSDRQVKANELVKEEDRLIKARHEAANENLEEKMNRRPKFEVGGCVWIYDDKSTFTGGGKHVLAKEAHSRSRNFAFTAKQTKCWIGPYKFLFVEPGTASDGELVGPSLILVEARKDEPSSEINASVSMPGAKNILILIKERKDRNFCPGL